MSKFRIKLQTAHIKSGKTAYAVARDLNLNQGTVRKYATEIVETEWLPAHVIQLADYYGVDWRDPDVVEVIEEDSEEDERKDLLAVPAS